MRFSNALKKEQVMYTFGFIGVGNMGGALARAVCCKCPPERVLLSNRTAQKAEALARELGLRGGG